MISEKMFKSFLEALADSEEKAKIGGRHLLLGNGFSIDCSDEFKYNSLYEKANLQQVCPAVHSFAENNNLYDLEKIIGVLQDSRELLESYAQHDGNSGDCQRCLDNIKEHIRVVKAAFVSAIKTVHPASPEDVDCLRAYKFLSHFNQIFTLNYDLLLYWTLMRGWENERNEITCLGYEADDPRFCDGFGKRDGRLIWLVERAKKVTVWYLHGALHFFYDYRSYDLEKLSYETKEGCVNLLEQIHQNIDVEKLPLVVAEGSSRRKKFQIDQYSYLQHAYNALKTLKGVLFTFGVSFREEDDHILEAIHESKLSDVYIGVYESEGTGEFDRFKARIKEFQEDYRKKKEKKKWQDKEQDKDTHRDQDPDEKDDEDKDKHEPTYHFYKSDRVKPWGQEGSKKSTTNKTVPPSGDDDISF
jgi:hypothetical protein